MTKLRITEIHDEKPVRITVDLPADLHRDLVAYATLLSSDETAVNPARLVAPMLRQFITSDKEFARVRRKPKGRPSER